jgi:hypothetical protein
MNRGIKALLIWGFLWFNIPIAISQQFIKLQGKIVDGQTTLPLPYTNIGLTNSSYGTISNQKGEFQLVVPSVLINEKLVFQFLGYKTVKIPVNECIEKKLSIKLSVLPVDLKTVNVKYRSPQDLIIAALNAVSSNFLDAPVTLTSFYKEEIRENNEKIQFIEAVMQIYKGTYSNGRDKDRIKIVKAREQANLKSSVFFKYLYFVDGPYEALALDVAKYPKHFIKIVHNTKNFLNPKHFRHYLYDFKEVVCNKGVDNQFVITFKPKSKKALLQGKVVLDKESLAFLAIEFWVPKTKVANARLIN